MPNFKDDNCYIPTQIISDYILKFGYDGIMHPSSLDLKGKNYLIFEHKNIEFDDNPDMATFSVLSFDIFMVVGQEVKYQLLLSSKM